MDGPNPKSTASIAGHPIHPMLIPFPIVCFIGALVTDLMFLATGDPGWATASNWLLGFGLGMGLFAAAAGLTDYMGDAHVRSMSIALRHMLANATVVVVEAINLALRLANPEFVSGAGVYLSGVAVLVLAYSGWLGGEMVFCHHVGVSDRHADEPGAHRPEAAMGERH